MTYNSEGLAVEFHKALEEPPAESPDHRSESERGLTDALETRQEEQLELVEMNRVIEDPEGFEKEMILKNLEGNAK